MNPAEITQPVPKGEECVPAKGTVDPGGNFGRILGPGLAGNGLFLAGNTLVGN